MHDPQEVRCLFAIVTKQYASRINGSWVSGNHRFGHREPERVLAKAILPPTSLIHPRYNSFVKSEDAASSRIHNGLLNVNVRALSGSVQGL